MIRKDGSDYDASHLWFKTHLMVGECFASCSLLSCAGLLGSLTFGTYQSLSGDSCVSLYAFVTGLWARCVGPQYCDSYYGSLYGCAII